MHVWSAEEHVDETRAEQLIREQFAPLPEHSVQLVSEGWDYVVHRVDGELAFRFPRREAVLPGMGLEIAVLGEVSRRLPVPVPAPIHVGMPSGGFPWPFYGARFLPGVELGDAALADEQRVELARPLAQALRALHAPEIRKAVGATLPFDPNARADMQLRVPRAREALDEVAALGLWDVPAGVEALLEHALELPVAEPLCVCHGDLHFRQVLVEHGEITGIIDWVDVCLCDPGIDLQLAFSYFGAEARVAFLDEYGVVDDASLVRAQVLALSLNALLARYGRVEGNSAVENEAIAGLHRASTSL